MHETTALQRRLNPVEVWLSYQALVVVVDALFADTIRTGAAAVKDSGKVTVFAAPGVLDAVAIPNIIFQPPGKVIREGNALLVNVPKPTFTKMNIRHSVIKT